MAAHAAPFSESDLVRFFNSLCETETKLKDATQSRYVIEIGLIKLVECAASSLSKGFLSGSESSNKR